MTIDQTRTSTPLENFLDSLADRQLTCYASDLLQQHGCETMDELSQAVKRATEVCNCMHLPLRENFKPVYRSKNGEVVQDWRLSPMAYMLTVLNADAKTDLVARTQIEMVRRFFNQ
ncbi:hypothetical protein PKOR_17890 [Pontibacter korlensis]|uniref:Uncharacterized protein n=1 Tax=Pontibacter korlensis TaxID=400092 RepID=A0A0E3ZHZ9_9BACT|nr:hypothetical protein PKOR_17890 [Pontibacter korlensis]